jgi:hypothetical protein
MFLRLATFLFISLLALQSYAGRDLILFVSATKDAPQISAMDPSNALHAANEFEILVNSANQSLPEASRPTVIKLEVLDLNEIPEKLDGFIAKDHRLAGSQIRMMFFAGHGNNTSFHLYADKAYTGREMAMVLTAESFQSRLAKDVGIYFSACKCGESLEPANFQVELMSEFKNQNERLAKEKQTRSLVSIAHRFNAVAASFKATSFGLDTILYNKGVFKIIDRVNSYAIKKLGRYVSQVAAIGVAAGLYGMATVLQNYVSPEAVGPAVTALLGALPKAAVGLGVTFVALSSMTSKWAQKFEYRSSEVSPLVSGVAVGNGVWQMIRMSGLTCEGLF